MGHARALLALEDAESQIALAREIVRQNLTVRDVEKLISRRKGSKSAARKPESDADLRAVEEELVKALGTKVTIAGNRKKGTIKISYFSLDDLNRIYGKIKGGSR